MKNIIKSRIALIIAFVGLTGGFIWILESDFQMEPIILVIVSTIEIIGFFLVSNNTPDSQAVINSLIELGI